MANGYHEPMGGGSHIPGEHGKLEPGQAIGAYVLVRELGRGGMGVVWLARDERLNRMVAIKTLHVGHVAGLGGKGAGLDQARAKLRERALGEARALAAIEHPNIASVFDVVESESGAGGGSAGGGTVFVVMEYVPGESLADRIRRSVSGGSGGLRVQEAVSIAAQVAEALAAAHAKGLLHRDLKPSNIQLTPEGVAKVLDFGLSSSSSRVQRDAVPGVARADGETAEWVVSDQRDGEGGDASSVKRAVSGTPAYMSPEQQSGEELDARSDMYAFGCVMYEMLTGQIAQRVLPDGRRGVHVEPVWDIGKIEGQSSSVPETVRTLLSGCLHAPKHERMRSAADAAVILRGVLDESRSGVISPRVRQKGLGDLLNTRAGVALVAMIGAALLSAFVALPLVVAPMEIAHSWYAGHAKMPEKKEQQAARNDIVVIGFGAGEDAVAAASVLKVEGVDVDRKQSWRRVHAAIVERLAKAKAKCIMLDFTFAPADNPEDSRSLAAAMTLARDKYEVPVTYGVKTWRRDDNGLPTSTDPQLLESGGRRGSILVDSDERTGYWGVEVGINRTGMTLGNTSISLETYLASLYPTSNTTLVITNEGVWVEFWRSKGGDSERVSQARRLPLNPTKVYRVDEEMMAEKPSPAEKGYQLGDIVAENTVPFVRSEASTEGLLTYAQLAAMSDAELAGRVAGKFVVIGDTVNDMQMAPDGQKAFTPYSHVAGLSVLLTQVWVQEVSAPWFLFWVLLACALGVLCMYFSSRVWLGLVLFVALVAVVVVCCLWMPRVMGVWLNPISLVVSMAVGAGAGAIATVYWARIGLKKGIRA